MDDMHVSAAVTVSIHFFHDGYYLLDKRNKCDKYINQNGRSMYFPFYIGV